MWICLAGVVAATVPAEKQRAIATVKRRKGPSRGRTRGRPAPREPLRNVPWVVAAVIVGLLCFVGAWRLPLADAHAKRGRDLFESGLAIEGEAEFDEAIDLVDLAQYRRLLGSYLGAAAVSLAKDEDEARQALAPGYYARAEEAYSYLDHIPHANALVDYARYLDLYADYYPEIKAEAVAVYHRALELDPFNPVLSEEVERVENTPAGERLK